MADNDTDTRDEMDRLIAADPNAHVVEGSGQAWLLTGKDQLQVARDAMPEKKSQ